MKKISTIALIALAFSMSSSAVMAGYGSSPSTGNNNNAPTCNNEKPGQANFDYVRKLSNSQIEVAWSPVDKATSWTIAYGTESGKYIYGMADFGDSQSRSVNINMMPAGVYYLTIKANNGCMPGNFSPERKMTIFGNGYVLGSRTVRPTGGTVLGNNAPTPTSTVGAAGAEEPTETPTTETTLKIENPPAANGGGNVFQRLWRWLFGE